MIRHTFSKTLSILIAVLFTLAQFVVPSVAQAQVFSGPQEWRFECVGGADNDVATIKGLECLIGNIFIVIITVIGFTSFIMFIIAAFNWLLSGGNTKNIETARNTMTFAVVGVIVSLSAFIILNLIAEFTGVNQILRFEIPSSETDLSNP